MCSISNKITFCACATLSPDRLRHYWILHRINKNKEIFILGQPFLPDENLYLFDHEANKLRLEQRLNDSDAFDFDAIFKSKDRFQIVLNNDANDSDQRVTYYFNFIEGKWKIDDAACYFDTLNNFDQISFGKLKHVRSKL